MDFTPIKEITELSQKRFADSLLGKAAMEKLPEQTEERPLGKPLETVSGQKSQPLRKADAYDSSSADTTQEEIIRGPVKKLPLPETVPVLDDMPWRYDPTEQKGSGKVEMPSLPIQYFTEKNETLETKATRELTEDEKNGLKEVLGWTDKQFAKCTIDEDGVIHYKTDREDMEGQTGENGVRYERKTVDIHGIKVEGVFPVFDSAYDVQLPEDLEQASNACQFKECNRQLKEAVESDPDLKDSFTDEQLADIEDGKTPEGYVWHHNEETGRMQLVKTEDHDRTQGGAAHTGGKALWGGGYSSGDAANSPAEINAVFTNTSHREE